MWALHTGSDPVSREARFFCSVVFVQFFLLLREKNHQITPHTGGQAGACRGPSCDFRRIRFLHEEGRKEVTKCTRVASAAKGRADATRRHSLGVIAVPIAVITANTVATDTTLISHRRT